MLKPYLSAIGISVFLFSGAATAAEPVFNRVIESKTIRCGYFVWPPYMLKDPNSGQLSGINYDIMEKIGAHLGFKIEWATEVGVGDVVAALAANKFDMMCASLWPNPAQIKNLTLSTPTFYSVAHAFVRADDKRFDDDLAKANDKSVKVGAIEGDITYDLATEKIPQAEIVALPQSASGAEILMQIVTKKADIALVDQGLVNDFLKTNPGTLRRVEGIANVRIFAEVLAVPQGEYALKNMIDQSVQQLTNDGVLDGITKKYAAQYKTEMLPPAKSFGAP